MENIVSNVKELIGKTPMVRLDVIGRDLPGDIIGKLEFFNPGGSVKDRIALSMIEAAEDKGELKPGMTIIEPSSGNTGIGLALVGAVKGYDVIITMPEDMSQERRKLMESFGAEIILTSKEKGMSGTVDRAEVMVDKDPELYMPNQFKNEGNPQVHRETTAEEIWSDTEGKIDIFAAGIGTGGTITGVGEVLKERKEDVEIIGVEPADSAVLSGEEPGPHDIQGIGAGFVPEVLNRDIIDEMIKVEGGDAEKMTRKLAEKEGILAGISSGAAVWAAKKLAGREEHSDDTIVTILPDSGERYLTTELFKGDG